MLFIMDYLSVFLQDADINFLVFGDWTLELDLRHNEIAQVLLTGVDPMQYEGAAASRVRILLAGNPLRCDCQLHELLARAAPKGPFELQRGSCAAPPPLRGTPLADVPLELLSCALEQPQCPAGCACALRPGLAPPRLTLRCAAPPPAPSACPTTAVGSTSARST